MKHCSHSKCFYERLAHKVLSMCCPPVRAIVYRKVDCKPLILHRGFCAPYNSILVVNWPSHRRCSAIASDIHRFVSSCSTKSNDKPPLSFALIRRLSFDRLYSSLANCSGRSGLTKWPTLCIPFQHVHHIDSCHILPSIEP